MGSITQIRVNRKLYHALKRSWNFSMPSKNIHHQGCSGELPSCQESRILYEVTVIFCGRFLNYRDRTVDQMVRAARPGSQGIAEGTVASGASWQMQIKQTNVARANMEDLLEDYLDYMRTHGHRVWRKSSPEAIYMRRMARNLEETGPGILELAKSRKAPEVCNFAICLIHQTIHLLDKQISQLESYSPRAGSLRERMYQVRCLAR
jgi:four helix bundle suffix protein